MLTARSAERHHTAEHKNLTPSTLPNQIISPHSPPSLPFSSFIVLFDIVLTPTEFLVDRSGKVVQRYSSTTKPSAISSDIEKLLSGGTDQGVTE